MSVLPCKHRRAAISQGFTLVEMLAVVLVIAILASLILPAIGNARRKADWTKCGSNLRQFGIAWLDYDGENNRWPDWLSTLYPTYSSSREMYVCAGDAKHGQIDGSKPQSLIETYPPADQAANAFNETDDFWGNNSITACSYFYELTGTNCTLEGALPGETWADYKRREIETVEDRTKFPIIRCYHHWQDVTYATIWDYPGGDGGNRNEGLTINVAYDGHVFHAPENWKATILSKE